MTCDYSSCPGIEKNIIDIGARAKIRETSAGFLKFLNVFNPNKSVIRKFFEDLIRCLHGRFDPRDLFYKPSTTYFSLPVRGKKLHTMFPVGLAGSCIK